MKRKWLKVLMMLMMAGASFGGPMNPKEIEDLMRTITLVPIRIWNCEEEKAEHLIA